MYSYPIDYDYYTSEEIIILIEFLSIIEEANTSKVDKELLLKKYGEYRRVLNNVSEEKKLEKEFEKVSGYSIYKTLKKYKG